MADPTDDPRIIEMEKQRVYAEKPMPGDMRELMTSALEGDPLALRLIQEHLDIGSMTAAEYARNWLGQDPERPRPFRPERPRPERHEAARPERPERHEAARPERPERPPNRMPMPSDPPPLGGGMTWEQINKSNIEEHEKIRGEQWIRQEDEMTKIFKSLLKASEQKAKEEQQ